MNKSFIFYIAIVFTLVIINPGSLLAKKSDKHALIIAIGEYKRSETGWSPISSKNDIPLIKNALMSQGFEEENIKMLIDDEADKAGIISALQELENNVSDNDYVVVHYSGHGQQISDNVNKDEIDGLDEALVSIKAPSRYYAGKNYTGEEHVRDEELGLYIVNIRNKVGKGGQVLVILDACHSGTGTRGFAQVRGGVDPLIIPNTSTVNQNAQEEGFGMSEAPSSRGNNDNKAPFVLFAGSKFDEPNYETKDENGNGVGSLSFAVSKAFMEIDDNSTYSSVFARVMEIMADVAPKQTPMIEGDINYKVFNGEVIPQEDYYEIVDIVGGNQIRISGGVVNGVSKGDIIGLYTSGTHSIDDEESVISGVVKETNNFTSIVEFDNDHDISNKKSYWAFIEEYNLEGSYVGIYVDPDLEPVFTESLKDINNLSQLVDDQSKASVIVTDKNESSRGSSTVFIKSVQTGDIIETERYNQPEVTAKAISEKVKAYTQGVFIKGLEMDDENYRVEIEFIPVIPELDGNGYVKEDEYGNFIVKDTLDINDFVVDGNIEFGENDYFMIKIKNTGLEDAYFSIIDIQPNGIINAFYPTDPIKPIECFVESGKSFIPRNFINEGWAPPFGKEVIKVFANKDVIDLSPIITTRGEGTRGLSNSLGALVKDSYATRGPKPKTGSVSNKDTGSSVMYPITTKGEE